MPVTDLHISFQFNNRSDNDPERAYYMPGDDMAGVVSLHLTAALKVKVISLHLLGVAHVAWEANHKKKAFSATETYLDRRMSLLDVGDRKVHMSSGLHKFSFTFQLPGNIPSSFIGVYGSVTYVAKVCVDCDDDRSSAVTSEPFLVLRRPTLSIEAKEPVDMRKSKLLLGLKSGKVKVTCSLATGTAAVPGHKVLIDADVCNWSNQRISLIQAAIIQESKYFADGKEIVFRQYLNSREDQYDTGNRAGRQWHRVQMLVPPYLPDSGLHMCNIMDVQYNFQFRVQIDQHDDVVVESPLSIGLLADTSHVTGVLGLHSANLLNDSRHIKSSSTWQDLRTDSGDAWQGLRRLPHVQLRHGSSSPWLTTSSWHRDITTHH